MQKAVAVVANDPSKLPGFLTWVGVSGSLGKALRSLTGLSDIQIMDGPQAPYMNASGTEFYLTLKGRTLGTDIFINRNHPLYNDAVKYISKKSPSKTGIEFDMAVGDALKFKGEHADPSSWVSYQTVEA